MSATLVLRRTSGRHISGTPMAHIDDILHCVRPSMSLGGAPHVEAENSVRSLHAGWFITHLVVFYCIAVSRGFFFWQNSEPRAHVRLKTQYVQNMDARQSIHFARVDFRNDDRIFGIKDE